MVEARIVEVLRFLNDRLRGKEFPWVIWGSTGQAIQGVQIDPKDIDILTDQAGLIVIADILKEYEVLPVNYEEVEKFKSFHGIYNIEGVKVDLLADFQYKVNITGRWSEKLNPNYYITVPFQGMELQVFRLKTDLQYYINLGDLQRVKLIREKTDTMVKHVGETTSFIGNK